MGDGRSAPLAMGRPDLGHRPRRRDHGRSIVAAGPPPSNGSTAPTNIEIGAEAGIFVAVLAVIVWYASSGQHPGQLVFRRRGSLARLRRGFRAGATAAAIPLAPVLGVAAVVLTISDSWTARATHGFRHIHEQCDRNHLLHRLAVSVHSWLNAPPERAGRASPAGSMAQDRRSSYVGALGSGVVAAAFLLVSAFMAMIVRELRPRNAQPLDGLARNCISDNADHARWSDMLAIFRSSPRLVILGGVVLPGIVVGLLLLITRAWPRFRLMALLATFRRQLPRNLL